MQTVDKAYLDFERIFGEVQVNVYDHGHHARNTGLVETRGEGFRLTLGGSGPDTESARADLIQTAKAALVVTVCSHGTDADWTWDGACWVRLPGTDGWETARRAALAVRRT